MNSPPPTKVTPFTINLLLATHQYYVAVISAMKTERGLALQDLISGTYEYVETVEFKPQARIYLLDFLSTTEYVSSVSRFVIKD
jgi:replication factor C subunit 3/5